MLAIAMPAHASDPTGLAIFFFLIGGLPVMLVLYLVLGAFIDMKTRTETVISWGMYALLLLVTLAALRVALIDTCDCGMEGYRRYAELSMQSSLFWASLLHLLWLIRLAWLLRKKPLAES